MTDVEYLALKEGEHRAWQEYQVAVNKWAAFYHQVMQETERRMREKIRQEILQETTIKVSTGDTP